ncbi:MAG: hypothetical protein H0V70_20445 [Ktedonobacteraceae bacterium]|nr:hypothetical protein [Ktedonobacteraceae bacterium]
MNLNEERAIADALELTDNDLETVFGGWGGDHDDDGGHHGWGHHGWDEGGYLFFGYPVPSYYSGPSFEGGPTYYGTPRCGC